MEVDSSKEAAICKSCGEPFITSKALKQFYDQYGAMFGSSSVEIETTESVDDVLNTIQQENIGNDVAKGSADIPAAKDEDFAEDPIVCVCRACGNDIFEGDIYCSYCGSKVEQSFDKETIVETIINDCQCAGEKPETFEVPELMVIPEFEEEIEDPEAVTLAEAGDETAIQEDVSEENLELCEELDNEDNPERIILPETAELITSQEECYEGNAKPTIETKKEKKTKTKKSIILAAICAGILCVIVAFVTVIIPMNAKAKAESEAFAQFVECLKNDAIQEANNLYFVSLGTYDYWDERKTKQLKKELEGMYAHEQYMDLVKVAIKLDETYISATSQPISSEKLIHACEVAGQKFLEDKDFYGAVGSYNIKAKMLPSTDTEGKTAARLAAKDAANQGLKYYITSNNLEKAIELNVRQTGDIDESLIMYVEAQKYMKQNSYNKAYEQIYLLKDRLTQLTDIERSDEIFDYYNDLCSQRWVNMLAQFTRTHEGVSLGTSTDWHVILWGGYFYISLNDENLSIVNILDDGAKSGTVSFEVKDRWGTDINVLIVTEDYMMYKGKKYYKSEWMNSKITD